uniref:Ig-like domain-containing protein n=1 Tax=Pseudonaja textilis TaxID=8673 RepID=A0A670ZJZ7_PSETE
FFWTPEEQVAVTARRGSVTLLCLSCASFSSFPPAKPTVTISPTKLDPASPNTILLCTARGFYPLEIEIQWLKNGKLEEEGVAFGEELQNGDWTYQLQVMLETQPQWGDIYTCQVGHVSLEAPITVRLLPLPQSPVPPALPGAKSGQGSWGL